MYGYTSGDNAPGLEILIRLQQTGLNLNWLANGKGSMILLEAGTAADRAAECERVLEEIVAKVEEYRAATEEIEVLRPSEMLTQEIIDIDDLQESPKRGSKREKVKK